MDKLTTASMSSIKVSESSIRILSLVHKGLTLVATTSVGYLLSMPDSHSHQCLRLQEGQKMLQQAHAEKGFIHLVGK